MEKQTDAGSTINMYYKMLQNTCLFYVLFMWAQICICVKFYSIPSLNLVVMIKMAKPGVVEDWEGAGGEGQVDRLQHFFCSIDDHKKLNADH